MRALIYDGDDFRALFFEIGAKAVIPNNKNLRAAVARCGLAPKIALS